jgi:hypothetical protein
MLRRPSDGVLKKKDVASDINNSGIKEGVNDGKRFV